MLRANERKYSLSKEVRALWEKLQKEGRQQDFEIQLWKTQQGIAIKQNLEKRNQITTKISVEKRPEDNEENLYIKVKVVRK